MNPLPNNTVLGRLELVEVYIYYDFPRLFACANGLKQYYLALWIDDDDTVDHWLYAPVSRQRLFLVRNGSMEIREPFDAPEEGFVYFITLPKTDHVATARALPRNDVDEDWLPSRGERLLQPSGQVPFQLEIDPRTYAQQSGFETLSFRLNVPPTHAGFPSARALGDVLRKSQMTIDALGQHYAAASTATERGRIPEAVLRNVQTAVVGTYTSSFGIVLAAIPPARLPLQDQAPHPDDTLAPRALDTLVDLVAIGNDLEQLRPKLRALSIRTVIRYRELLKTFSDSNISINMERRSPSGVERSAFMSPRIAHQTTAMIRQVERSMPGEIMVRGYLTGFWTTPDRFALVDAETGHRYEGGVSEDMPASQRRVTQGKKYDATIIQIIDVNPATGQERESHRLADIREVESDEA